MSDDDFEAALRELLTLDRIPLPTFREPPWAAIRAALPPGTELPNGPVHVLVDLDIDEHGLVVRAEVGEAPADVVAFKVCHPERSAGNAGAKSKDLRDGEWTSAPPTAPPTIARVIAAAHLGARFTPAIRGGQPVAVRRFRMGIEVGPEQLRAT